MGRHEPLTALALGRSPYDEVVWPNGDPDDSGSDVDSSDSESANGSQRQQYDHKGRPVNPATKTLNREIVRAHNEVMHVIGVAEPDILNNEAEMQSARRYLAYEQKVGDQMEYLGKGLMEVGIWAFTGLRHRVMLYKAFSEVPYYKIPALCRRTIPHPWTSLLLAGIPTDLGARGIQWLYEKAVTAICLRGIPMPWQLFDFIEEYITYHVQVHIFLQKVGILSPWQIPSPLFFIPFTSSSLIPAPTPPADFSAGSLLQWLGAAAINAGPFLAYALWRKTWSWLRLQVMGEIYHRLPLPEGFPEYRVRAGPSTNPVLEQSLLPTSAQQPYVSPAETEVNAEPSTIRQRESDSVTPQMPNERGLHASMQSVHAQDGTGPPRPGPGPTAIRRRSSTFSGRGDDFGSDDEDAEAIPGPLISFDVETMDAADAPPGVWFTELRPTVSSDSPSQASQQPVPLNTGLTRQPIQHASRVLGTLATSLLLAPAEAFVLRYLARSFLVHRGWPVEHMFNLSLGAWSLRWFTNYLFVDFLHLSLQTEFWSAVVSCGWVMHLTPEDWTCVSVEQQAEWA